MVIETALTIDTDARHALRNGLALGENDLMLLAKIMEVTTVVMGMIMTMIMMTVTIAVMITAWC